jgi:hypothetical protein
LHFQVIPEPLTDPAYTIEEHMKSEVLALEAYIPQVTTVEVTSNHSRVLSLTFMPPPP